MYFGIDSSMSGNGSAKFARIQPQVAVAGYRFSLVNCLGIARYSIEEAITKIDKMGAHEQTMGQDPGAVPFHEHSEYFFRYNVFSDDGTIVLQTNFFRMFSDKVQFSA